MVDEGIPNILSSQIGGQSKFPRSSAGAYDKVLIRT